MSLVRRNLGIAVTLLLVAIPLCIAFVDRAVATYMRHTLYATPLSTWALRIFVVLLGIGGCLVVLFLVTSTAALSGRPIRPWMSIALAASGAGIVGGLLAELLKFSIGRSQAYPTYLDDGIYGMSPFHGSQGYGSFPSATETIASAVLVVLWMLWPSGRRVYALALVIISAALIITNSHWISDLVGGVLLGGALGLAAVRRLRWQRRVSP